MVPSLAAVCLLSTIRPDQISAQRQQATLTGSILDETGRPHRGAQVQIVGQNIVVSTDAAGRFVQHNLPAGPTTLRASTPWSAMRDTTVVLQAGATLEWRVVLPSEARLRDGAQKAEAAAGRVDSIAIGGVTTDTSLAFTYTSFGLGLLHATVERFSPDSNRVLSPVGAGEALGVALLGARDSTRLAIAHTLGLGRLAADSLASRNQWLNNHFASRRDLVLKVANAVWVDASATLNPAFERTVQQAYTASVRTMPLTSAPIVDALNRWADSTTAGRIRQVIDKPFEDLTKVVLTNAVYLKSTWLTPFDSNHTKPRPFTLRSGEQLMVPMMERTDGFAYRRGDHFQAVRLPYKDGLTALYVVLPDSGSSALATLDHLRGTEWPFPNPTSEARQVHVVLPKLHVEQQTDLVDPLKALGMGIAFDPRRADLGNLLKPPSDRLFLSKAQQNTYFDVDETGTEAAAVTVITVRATSAPRITEFVVDRPFLLALRDEKTGALLFVGYIARPM